MKRFLSIIGTIILSVIFIPLFLGLFFGMPLEFIVSSWHNLRLDSSTQGIITHSKVIDGKGANEGSAITYTYECDGKSYKSSRWRAGLISNSSAESNGGDFAKKHPKGTVVTVYYDASNPSFSLLERGWPKWSVGFSLGVWGILFSHHFQRNAPRTNRLLLCYPLSRATLITGFLTLFFFPTTLNGSSFNVLFLIFIITAIIAWVWLVLCAKTKLKRRTVAD